MGSRKAVAQALAAAMLCGSLSKGGLLNRGASVIGRRPAWLRHLAEKIVAHFGKASRPRRFRIEEFILNDKGFLKAYEKGTLSVLAQPSFRPKMCPAAGPPRTWKVAPLRTLGELAQWLNLLPNELA